MNITGISASSHAPPVTGPADVTKCPPDPVPIVKPSAMKISSADTLSPAKRLVMRRPGPTPRTWMHVISAIAQSAMALRREKVSGT